MCTPKSFRVNCLGVLWISRWNLWAQHHIMIKISHAGYLIWSDKKYMRWGCDLRPSYNCSLRTNLFLNIFFKFSIPTNSFSLKEKVSGVSKSGPYKMAPTFELKFELSTPDYVITKLFYFLFEFFSKIDERFWKVQIFYNRFWVEIQKSMTSACSPQKTETLHFLPLLLKYKF